MEDILVIQGHPIRNRFFIGSGKFGSYELMRQVIEASRAHIVTVALRRVDTASNKENVLDYIPSDCILMPNTSGARTAEEAVRIAEIARELCRTKWIKVEVISDNKYLLPDNYETIRATETLAKRGFIVMPYMNPDLMDARRLRDAGAATIMPLGAPIGTNKGMTTREIIKIIINEIALPVVVDAGIGRPSQAAEAMEIGAAAVLANTAVATAEDPVRIARAFSLAVEGGREGFRAGLGAINDIAQASSPLTGFLH
ncbi:MAG: thiazole synthase [Spirochaetes bacterium]|nr:thiazole synthase [Spirochaetota bacterium]